MKIRLIILSLLSSTIFLHQCGQTESSKSDKSHSSVAKTTKYSLDEVWSTDTVMRTPESVIYDRARNAIYVSNVNENPWEADNNGFISKLSSSGAVTKLNWVSGFSGPKGMAIMGSRLYVADLDEIGIIDIDQGKIIEKIKVDGATGLNDITPGNDDDLFISDSNGGKLFHYKNGKVTVFHGDTPGRPNGLLVKQNVLLVAFSQAADFVSYDLTTKEKHQITEGIGHGDGITPTNDDDTYLVSDWSGEIFLIKPDGSKQSLLRTKDDGKNTADIWFIPEQDLVLVPTFFDNRVVAYKLNKN